MRHYDSDDLHGPSANPVHLSRVDVPFLDLLWLFLKSSLALALAFTLTGWLWVMIGTGVVTLIAGSLWLLGVPRLLEPPQHPQPVAITAPPPPPAPLPQVAQTQAQAAPVDAAPPTSPALPVPSDPNHAATEALQRQELERHRQAGP